MCLFFYFCSGDRKSIIILVVVMKISFDCVSCGFPQSREARIAAYMLITLLVMLLEFAYGYFANSLGLICDSFHMLLDACSLIVGLVAAVLSRKEPNVENPFGYARYEVFCSFINGILLLFIAFYVILEALERIVNGAKTDGPYIFVVAFIGLLVNIIGVLFFHDSCSHSHGCNSDHNLRGIYFHILADLLGSIAVLCSSIAISFGLWFADPLFSGLCAFLIFGSTIPLLKDTGSVLALSEEDSLAKVSSSISREIALEPSVIHCQPPRIWIHSTTPNFFLYCCVNAKLQSDANYYNSKKLISRIAQEKIHEFVGGKNRIIIHLEK